MQQKENKKQTFWNKTEIRSIYNRPIHRKKKDMGKSRTQQHFTEESKMSTIMAKYTKTGIIGTGLGTRKPQFGDYTGVDYREMQNKIIAGSELFMTIPSEIRKKFDNRVDLLLDFIDKDENRAEAIQLGLIVEPEKAPQEPIKVGDDLKKPGGSEGDPENKPAVKEPDNPPKK